MSGATESLITGQPGPRVLVAGATGYIGRHVTAELLARGYKVVALARPQTAAAGAAPSPQEPAGAEWRFCDVGDADALQQDGIRGESFDFFVSCLGSRTGGFEDAWRVEYQANRKLLEAAQGAGVRRFVLLSAICVQKPRLAFQHAKLAFESELVASGLDYAIVRPTAFFKSLAGQVQAVARGKPFMVFGNGELTACKPIAEADLARYLVDCLVDEARRNRILPIGGPGPAVSPRQQAGILAELLGRPVPVRRIPLWIFRLAISVLTPLGRVFPVLRDKAEFARIGQYYASESMLAWDPVAGRYVADATPEYGETTLRQFYAQGLAQGLEGQELGDHALFDRRR